MKLHHISIKHFRGIDHFDVAFDVEGVTIVEGDNEIGKSCIPEALQLVLETPDSAKSKAVRDVKPVHRDVAPEVVVEISTGPYHFVLEKRWLRQASTTLTITSPHRQQFTGRDAHDRVQQILDETLDHDLWSALNVEQGGDSGLPNFNVPALGRALDAAAGGQISTTHDDDLWERIVTERDRYWTATGKPKGDRVVLIESVTHARDEVASVTIAIGQLDSDIAEVERLESALPGLTAQLDMCRANESELDERWRAAELAATARRAALAECDAAAAGRDRAGEKCDERRALVADVERVASVVTIRESGLARTAPAEVATKTRLEEVFGTVGQARADLVAAEAFLKIAAGDTTYRRQQIEVEQFTERLDQVRDAETRLLEAERVVDRVRVTPELLKDIEARHLDGVRAEAALGLGAAVVRAEALATTTIIVDGVAVGLDNGEAHESKVSGDLHLEIPGLLRLAISAGSESQDLAAEADRLGRRYQDACRDAGVADVSEARVQLTERQTAEQVAAAGRDTIKAALRDLTPDALSSKIASLGDSITEYEQGRPTEPQLPADHDEAQSRERAAVEAVADQRQVLSALEIERAKVADELHQIGIEAAASNATLDAARQELASLQRRLSDARTQIDDETLDADVAASDEKLRDATVELDGANRQAADDDLELLSSLVDIAKAATARLSEEIDSNKQLRTEARARLDLRGDEGLQHQLDRAQTELAHLEREHTSLERRADAALLLHDVAAECREEIRRRYHEPFRQQIERLGSILVGDTFEVELDQDLRIARRTLGEVTLDFDQLSAGAREQLGIISRLACATIVSEQGGAPVILDDTLGWTDPSRLSAMGAIIAVAGKDCQVIVLTCTPGRYAAVGNASIVRLSKTSARRSDAVA